jgi:hypothetical protein
MNEPRAIYLEPAPGPADTGRRWCEHDDPEGEGRPWAKYIREGETMDTRNAKEAPGPHMWPGVSMAVSCGDCGCVHELDAEGLARAGAQVHIHLPGDDMIDTGMPAYELTFMGASMAVSTDMGCLECGGRNCRVTSITLNPSRGK